MERRVLLLMMILTASVGFGQTQFSIDLSGTYSFISNPGNDLPPAIPANTGFSVGTISTPYTQTFKLKPGVNINFGITKQLKNRFSIRFGIGFSLHQFKKESRLNAFIPKFLPSDTLIIPSVPDSLFFIVPSAVSNTEPALVGSSNNGKTKILYVSIPVIVQYSLIPDKFTVGVGVVNYLVAYSSQIRTVYDYRPYYSGYYDHDDNSSNGLNNYILGGSFVFSYKLLKSWEAQLNYNHSFSSIYDKEDEFNQPPRNPKAKYRTIGLGVSYNFR